MSNPTPLEPGTVVLGRFYSDDGNGIGIVVKPTRGGTFATDPAGPYTPVRVLHGDRASGGYLTANLTPVPEVKPA